MEGRLQGRLMLSLNGRGGDQRAQLLRGLEPVSEVEGRGQGYQDGSGDSTEVAQETPKMSPDISTCSLGVSYAFAEAGLHLGRGSIPQNRRKRLSQD